MAVVTGPARSACPTGRGRNHHRARSTLRHRRPHAAAGNRRWPKNRSERQVAQWLNAQGIEWRYEPRSLNTGLTGRRRAVLRPDFYLPELNLYLEVTIDRSLDFKRAKVRGADRRAGGRATVLLVAGDELEAMKQGRYTIPQLAAA